MRLFIVSARGVATEAPPLRLRPAVVVGGEMVTVALPREAQRAMRDAHVVALQAMRVALAPFGLTPWDIAMPTFCRIVTEDELKGH